MKVIKDFLRALMLVYKRILYKIACLTTKVDDKAVFFESFQGRNYSCSPKAIFEEMKTSGEYKDYQYTWAFRDVDKNYSDKSDSIVRYESYAYYKALAKAKYWILNSNTRKFLKPRKEQVYVQTWHGTPLKKIGLDVPGSGLNYGHEGKKFSYMISPSKYCSEKLISAFGLQGREDIILETGYPRNDELFDFDQDKVDRIKDELGIPADKKVILYAPTFRDNKHSQIKGYENAAGLDFEKLQNVLGNEYLVLFRAHYFVASQIDFDSLDEFVIDASDYEDINDLYIVSDLLVTDYSSVFFDYANLKRPIIFYMYDYEDYKENARDFYLAESELPGPVTKTQEELEKVIKMTSDFTPDAKYTEFNNKFNYLDGKQKGLEVARRIF